MKKQGFRLSNDLPKVTKKLQLYSGARVPSVTTSVHYLNDHTSQTIRCLRVPPTNSKGGRQVEYCPETKTLKLLWHGGFHRHLVFHQTKASQFKLWQILTYFATQNRNHKRRNIPHFTEQHTRDLKSSFLNNQDTDWLLHCSLKRYNDKYNSASK